MNTEVTVAVITVCGVIFSTTITLVVGFWSKRHNQSQLFAEVVSENRIEWMNSLRINLSKFLANAETLRDYSLSSDKDGEKYKQYVALKREMLEAKGLVTTRLNLEKELQRLMFTAIKDFDYTSENFTAKRIYVEDLARRILRPEWDSVKNEAKGKEN